MTSLRTYPPNTYITKPKLTLTKDNFGMCYITIPFEYLSAGTPETSNDYYGHVTDYDHRIDLLGHNEPAFQTLNHFDYAGYARFFRPASTQLWNGSALHKTGGTTGTFNGGAATGMGVFGELLLTLDYWHSKNIKCLWVMTLYNTYAPLSFWGDLQMSAAHETNLINYLEALLTDTTTSPLGYTFANHPALKAVELANEATGSTGVTVVHDPVGTVKANIARIARQIFDNYRTGSLAVSVIGCSGIGGIHTQYQALFGGNPMSQSTAAAVSATVGGASTAATRLAKTTHGLVDGDMVRLEAETTGASSFSETTNYYVVNKTTNTYQLSLTSGGAAINDTVSDVFEVFTLNGLTGSYTESAYNWKQSVTTNAVLDMSVSTSIFTQASHALQNGMVVRLRRVPNINGVVAPTAWKTTGPVYGSLVRWYFVKTVVDANNVELAWTPGGTTADFGTNVINVKFYKSTPATLYGEDGIGKFYSDFSNTESHHHYGGADTYAELIATNNKITYDNIAIDKRATAIGYLSYNKFGGRLFGTASFATDDFVTFTYKVGVKNGRKVKFYASTMPTGILKSTTYYMTASDTANNKCKLTLTYADAIAVTNIVDITSTTGSVNTLLMHPWFDETVRPKWWDTEFNSSVSASDGAYISKLSLTDKKAWLFKTFLSSLMNTSNGAGDVGTSFMYAIDWAGWNGVSNNTGDANITVTGTAQSISSNGGFLRITLKAGAPSHPISTNERICIKTGANPIVGTSETISASSYKTVAITAISGASSNILDTDFPYTGGAVASITYTVERYAGPGLDEWTWFVNLMTNNMTTATVSLGYTEDATGYPAPMAHIEGVGVYYMDSTGNLKTW